MFKCISFNLPGENRRDSRTPPEPSRAEPRESHGSMCCIYASMHPLAHLPACPCRVQVRARQAKVVTVSNCCPTKALCITRTATMIPVGRSQVEAKSTPRPSKSGEPGGEPNIAQRRKCPNSKLRSLFVVRHSSFIVGRSPITQSRPQPPTTDSSIFTPVNAVFYEHFSNPLKHVAWACCVVEFEKRKKEKGKRKKEKGKRRRCGLWRCGAVGCGLAPTRTLDRLPR